jgi:hypothetical protein
MDEKLIDLRYDALFEAYKPSRPLLLEIKDHLSNKILEKPGLLRGDAKVFLLVNVDQMIIRALTGKIPTVSSIDGLSEIKSESDLRPALHSCIDMIIDDVRHDDVLPVSAHSIMRSMDRRWKDIELLLGWA